MKRRLLPVLLVLSASCAGAQEFSTTTMRRITMDEAFVLAATKSEELAGRKEGIAALEAGERYIRSAFFPRAGLAASQFRQERPDSSVQGSRAQAAVNAEVSLFSGMRDYIQAKAAGAAAEAAKLDLARARQSLYLSVTEAYLDLLSAQWDIEVRSEQMKISRERLEELSARAEIGRSRPSEVLAARSQLAQDEAQLQNALGAERVNQQIFKFITGESRDMTPAHVHLPAVPAVEGFLLEAEHRPDIAARRKDLEAAGFAAAAQRRLSWPSLDAGGNYYLKRPASLSNIHWDAELNLRLPLYTGGGNAALTDRAEAGRRAAEAALSLARRQAETEVRQAHETLVYSLAMANTLYKAVKLGRENAKAQMTDYKLGLVTNLDVLNAMNSLLQTRIQHYKAHVQAFRASIRLAAAAGGAAGEEP